VGEDETWLTGDLDVDEIDVVGCGVDHGPKGHRVRDLSVEPDILVRREQPSQFGANDTNDVSQHGYEDKGTIEGQDEACSTGNPDGKLEGVERAQARVCFL
jgi:hypothetical protein